MVEDPVCGSAIDPTQARLRSDYQGRTYYFCSLVCKELFDQDPQRYIRQQADAALG